MELQRAMTKQESIMRKEENNQSRNRYSISRTAHVVERSGLAIAGALCGLFVAAQVERANVAMLNSMGFVVSMCLVGLIGFYLGIDIPRNSTPPFQTAVLDESPGLTMAVVELLSAAGTLLATMAALVSVYVIVFDEVLPLMWTLVVGFWWLLGITMQTGAGVMARRRVAHQAAG
jgi:uncharacterized membrane protein AbrB (regulator of aidB expression)